MLASAANSSLTPAGYNISRKEKFASVNTPNAWML